MQRLSTREVERAFQQMAAAAMPPMKKFYTLVACDDAEWSLELATGKQGVFAYWLDLGLA